MPIAGGKAAQLRHDASVASAWHSGWRGHVRTISLFAALFSASLSFAAQAAGSQPSNAIPLPTITTAKAAHDLSSQEAGRAYPVHLRGVVTYFDPGHGKHFIAMFLHDKTGSVFIKPPSGSVGPLEPGTLIEVWGISQIGGFGPIVANPRIRVIGQSHLPPSDAKASYSQLITGGEDGAWVQVEGTIHSVIEYPYTVTLVLAMVDGTINVTMMKEAGRDYAHLVDAKVRLLAHAAPMINANSQMIGVHLMAPNLSALTVLQPAPADSFESPLVPIDDLLRWSQVSAWVHRVHVRGSVTLQWPGSSLCIRDASGAICAKSPQMTPMSIGDVVDVAGFSGAEDNAPVLTDAVYRSVANGAAAQSRPVAPQPVTAEQALLGRHQSQLVQIDGRLVGRDLTSSDVTLLLSSGKFLFSAILPKSLAGPQVDDWKIGSTLRVTGICSVQLDTQTNVRDGVAVAETFRILMRSPQDVTILQHPSWWTTAHALYLLAVAFALTLGVLAWVVALRRHVQQQANLLREQAVLLRESEQRFRHMALHDSLTGLATRLLLQDRLVAALETSIRRKTGLAILMLDIDRFKQINDTFGHPGGDEVLCVTANRILEAVRKGDTVARMGGDEFVVLLPDLIDRQAAERIAANLVECLSVPIPYADRDVEVSVSIGVCTALAGECDAETLLAGADVALYFAKEQGRNCYQVFKPEPAPPGPTSAPGRDSATVSTK
jgi:diguanylate cyclase (GGDEF)-like protein